MNEISLKEKYNKGKKKTDLCKELCAKNYPTILTFAHASACVDALLFTTIILTGQAVQAMALGPAYWFTGHCVYIYVLNSMGHFSQ
jgi:hypothetical protein